MFSKVEKIPTASIFQKHLSFEGRWQGGLRCAEHLAEGERFPRLHTGTKIFLETREQMDPNTTASCTEMYCCLPQLGNRFAVREIVT